MNELYSGKMNAIWKESFSLLQECVSDILEEIPHGPLKPTQLQLCCFIPEEGAQARSPLHKPYWEAVTAVQTLIAMKAARLILVHQFQALVRQAVYEWLNRAFRIRRNIPGAMTRPGVWHPSKEQCLRCLLRADVVPVPNTLTCNHRICCPDCSLQLSAISKCLWCHPPPSAGARIAGLTVDKVLLAALSVPRRADEPFPSKKELSDFTATCANKPRCPWAQDYLKAQNRIACVVKLGDTILPEQESGIEASLVKSMAPAFSLAVTEWVLRAARARRLCDELTPSKPKLPAKPAAVEKVEPCICCMDAERSTIYRPCRCRVCCDDCAQQLWARSQSCPWCGQECEEP